jgi:XTP/dITP diphosphohydrolase
LVNLRDFLHPSRMQTKPRLVVATRNAHKTSEIRALLGDRYEVLDSNDFLETPRIEETGTTFLENARLKAEGVSQVIDGWVLSDDSGLEVDVLDGAPGVWSSSYGGEEGNHILNNERLLRELEGKTDRRARFLCTMVLAREGLEVAHFTGAVEGRIIDVPRGGAGFGYDPLFIPDGYDETFAELGEDVKNTLSHRSIALMKVVDFLENEK